MLLSGFDELNVIQQVETLYANLDGANRKKFKELWMARYIEMLLYLDLLSVLPTDDTIDALVEMRLANLLEEPNAVTNYAYDAEVYRKRDRAKEAVNSVAGNVLKQVQMDKHLKYWSAMTGYYADLVSQDAEIQALKDSGVERVIRHEVEDAKTCRVCEDADGEIYDIDKIPPLPHLHCRRWFTPAK